jgi:TonB family protein
MKPLILSLLLLASVAHGQGAYRIGGGVSAPRVISKNEPEYSEAARKARLEGTAIVVLVVNEDGTLRNVRVPRPLGLGLDEKAIETVRSWRFAPGQKEGKPVPVIATIEVNFRLGDVMARWHLTRAAFRFPEGASTPSLVKQEFPADAPAGLAGFVDSTLVVGVDGAPSDIHVERSSDPSLEPEVISALRNWRFTPALKDNTPISTSMTVEFSLAVKAGMLGFQPPVVPQ